MRSEDCKIVYNAGVGWGAFALTDSTYEGMNMVDAGDSMPLHDEAETEKPTYQWIEEVRWDEERSDNITCKSESW